MRPFPAALAAMLLSVEASGQNALSADGALLRALDTITGKSADLILRAGEAAEFGKIRIALEECRFLPENPLSGSYAFVRVIERDTGESLFDAWMIASAPALSAMDHHRYDVWLIRCSTAAPDSGSS